LSIKATVPAKHNLVPAKHFSAPRKNGVHERRKRPRAIPQRRAPLLRLTGCDNVCELI
jgi:hypothetical protein